MTGLPQHKRIERDHYRNKVDALGPSLHVHGPDAVPEALRSPYLVYQAAVERLALPGGVIVDLGAGTGIHSLLAAGHGRRVIGTDVVIEALRQARRRADLARARVFAACADAEDLPFAARSVDLVTSAGVLYCLDVDAVTSEICRVLRPTGAWAFIDAYDHNPVYRLNRWLGVLWGKRTPLAARNVPNAMTVERVRRRFRSIQVSYHGVFTFAVPFLQPVIGARRTARVLAALDRAVPWLRHQAFRIVVIAEGPLPAPGNGNA